MREWTLGFSCPISKIQTARRSGGEPRLRLVGNLVASSTGATNEVDPSTIRINEPVRVVFQPVGDVFLPRWLRP